VYVDDLAAHLEQQVLAPLTKYPGTRDTARRVAEEIEAIREWGGGRRISFAEAESLKRSLDEAAQGFNIATPGDKVQALQRVRGAAGGFNEAAAESADPALAEAFKAAKQRYGNLAPADEYFKDFALRQAANRNLSLSSNVLASMGGVQGMAMGLANQIALNRGRASVAVVADNIAKLLQRGGTQAKAIQLLASNKAALGRYGAMLARALADSPESFEALHISLESTDPEYQRALGD
jgi:hypothetical protein